MRAQSLPVSSRPPFDAGIIATIFTKELNGGEGVDASRLAVLELTGYLENYLLPHFDAATATFEHVMSIVLVRY